MMYTKEQMVKAYLMGHGKVVEVDPWTDAERYVEGIAQHNVDTYGADALRIAPEAAGLDQPCSGHLPPNGTGEEVTARVLASLLCRTAIMFKDEPGADCLFSTDWQESVLEDLRTAFPISGAFEDGRVEETA